MNWVGGARNRIKVKHEKKIQKEFFERKRHTKKVHRSKQEDRQENDGKTAISQDLLALQALVSAHDKPKRKPREVRRALAVDLNDAKRKEHPKRKYCVELPESPGHHKPSTLDLCDARPDLPHVQKKHQDIKGIHQPWTKHQDNRKYLQEEVLYNAQIQPLLPKHESFMVPFSIDTWTNLSGKERSDPNSSLVQPPQSFVVQEPDQVQKQQDTKMEDEANALYRMQRDSNEVFKHYDFYHTPNKQRKTNKGKFLSFSDDGLSKTPKGNNSPVMIDQLPKSPFVPFSEPGPLIKFNITQPNVEQEENRTFQNFKGPFKMSSGTGHSENSTKTVGCSSLYAEVKPVPLETPVQTWTARKASFERKNTQWSHFQIHPGHPPRKNPFFDKETAMDKPVDIESKPEYTFPCNMQDKKDNDKRNDGKMETTKWNPFNLSYPVKIESGGEKNNILGCGQETAWRTFLKGSKRLSTERLQSLAQKQHKNDPSSEGGTPENEETSKKTISPDQEPEGLKMTKECFTPESEVRETSHDHEALKEVMDLEKDADQSSEMTSSWSSTFTDDHDNDIKGNGYEPLDDHKANQVTSSKKCQLMVSASSAGKSSSPNLIYISSNLSSQVKSNQQSFDKELSGLASNILYKEKSGDITVNVDDHNDSVRESNLAQVTESPSAFLMCTESVDFFNKVEKRTAGPKKILFNMRCTGTTDRVVREDDRDQGNCRKKEIQATDGVRIAERMSEQQQLVHRKEKGTQTQNEWLNTMKEKRSEVRTTEQESQTQSDLFTINSRKDTGKTTQTENAKWLETVRQGTPAQKDNLNNLTETGNEVQTTPMNAFPYCAKDINRKTNLFVVNQLKEGSAPTDGLENRHENLYQILSNPHFTTYNVRENDDDLLSNQKNIIWYLSLLINVLTHGG